jgi:hypothetical protein
MTVRMRQFQGICLPDGHCATKGAQIEGSEMKKGEEILSE